MPISDRISVELDQEFRRMANDWFFKWHHIGGNQSIEIDSFEGRPIRYGGIKFAGTARAVYWQTISNYLRKKMNEVVSSVEGELANYPIQVRLSALQEVSTLLKQFAMKIRDTAVEKDRILRGNGFEFPAAQDLGRWDGSRPNDIQHKIDKLIEIYCDIPSLKEGNTMPFRNLMNDKVTLVDKSGTVVAENLSASVQPGIICTMNEKVPIQVGDHFLRKLPSGLVEDYEILDPGYHTRLRMIPGHYQSKVQRSDLPVSDPKTVINNITQTFNGDHARGYVQSIDKSTTATNTINWTDVANLLEQVKPVLKNLPEPQRNQISDPIAALENEIKSGKPDQSRMRSALVSMKTIAEGTAGNLLAAGIIGMVTLIL